MLKTIPQILLVLLYCVSLSGKTTEDSYNLVYPKFIPQNSAFETSLITSKKFPSADRLEIYILPDNRVNLNRIDLKSIYENTKLEFYPAYLDEFGSNCFKTEIDLENSSLYPEDFFEVLFSFRADNSSGAEVKFFGIYKSRGRVIGYLDNAEGAITADVKFYKTQKNAGRSIQLNRQSQLVITCTEDIPNLLAEFWLKINDPDISILKIVNKKENKLLAELSCNQFQMLTASSEKQMQYLSPCFTGKKSWYHISVFYSSEKNNLSIYCNGLLLAMYRITDYISAEDFVYTFAGNEQGKTYQLDLLRFVDLNNSIEVSFYNRSYLNFISDSSRVLAQLAFDNDDDINIKDLDIVKKDIQYIKSDAPVTARAPEVNIMLLSNAYELEWSGGDYKQASSYVLEKSTGGGAFRPVFTIQADKENEKLYSYLDDRDNSSEIIYYRVKQVNDDGTNVFSSQVKVGQGPQEPFTLKQNYPNPFNPRTSIDIDLLEDTNIEITIYNLEGEQVVKLFKGSLSRGFHKFEFNAKELPSGIYIYKVSSPGYSQSRKMLLTK